MTRTCQVDRCDNPLSTSDQTTACPGCFNRLHQALGEVPALIAELNTTLSRQDALGDGNGVRGTETPLPYHQAASDTLTDLLGTLTAWANLTHAPVRSHPALRLLNADLHTHPEAHILITEITDATARAWATIDRAPDRTIFGPCWSVINDVTCREPIYAKPGADTVRCRTCGTEWNVATRRDWLMAGLRDTLATVAEARRILAIYARIDVKQQRISRWKERGQLTPRQHDDHGSEMYRIGDIEALAAPNTRRVDNT